MRIKNLILIFLLACCFAPSFLFMKVSVAELPPLTVVTLRVSIAAFILLILLKFQRIKLKIFRPYFKHFLFAGVIGLLAPFFLITLSEKTISSALAGLINGSVPIFTMTLAHFFIPSDRINRDKSMGTILGILGLVLIFIPSIGQDIGSAQSVAMVIIASLCYGIVMVYSKIYLHDLPPLVAPTCQLIAASLVAIPLCLFFDRPYTLPFPSLAAVGSILGLAIIGGTFAYPLYFKALHVVGASYLSLTTLIFPLLAIFLGVTFLHETLEWNAYAGGAMILLGLVIATEIFAMKPLIRKENIG